MSQTFPDCYWIFFEAEKRKRRESIFIFLEIDFGIDLGLGEGSEEFSNSSWKFLEEEEGARFLGRRERELVGPLLVRSMTQEWPSMNRGERAGTKFLADPKISSALSLSPNPLFLYLRFPLSRGYKVEERLVESLNSGSPPSSSQVVGSRCLFLLFPPSLSLSLIEKLFRKFGIRIKSKQIRTFPRWENSFLSFPRFIFYFFFFFVRRDEDKISSNYFQIFDSLSLPRAQTLDYRWVIYICIYLWQWYTREVDRYERGRKSRQSSSKRGQIINILLSLILSRRVLSFIAISARLIASFSSRKIDLRFILSSTTGSELNLTSLPSPDIFPEFSLRPLREKVETDSRFFSYEILLRFSNGIVFEDSFSDKFLCFVLLDRMRNTESFHAIINSRIRSRSDFSSCCSSVCFDRCICRNEILKTLWRTYIDFA